jgi:ABC-2 type transport system permease protein
VVLTGYVAGAVMRGVLVGIIVMAIALFFTSLHIAHPLVAVTTVILGATIFSLAGFINAIFAKRFDDIAIVPTFILQPLSYLGGVFYSVKLLGSPWQEVSLVNPILYFVNAFRFGILGVSDVPVWGAYVVMLAFVIVLGAVALWLMNKGVGLRS